MRVVVALGGNALLKRGEPMTAEVQRANVKVAAQALAPVAREHELVSRAFDRWGANDRVEILGHPDPARRVAIVSFNLKAPDGSYLHPKFVTTVANDLFGLQSRAGCSCAGPYGHRLLDIDQPTSERYRKWIHRGYHGIKPGWCRKKDCR